MKFKNGDHVRFHSTSDDVLDSLTGTVCGLVADLAESCFYVVRLHEPHEEWQWDCICMTEHCLELNETFDMTLGV